MRSIVEMVILADLSAMLFAFGAEFGEGTAAVMLITWHWHAQGEDLRVVMILAPPALALIIGSYQIGRASCRERVF